jgi:CDP-diacylglycerol--serine O-phosphatidyltransferase
MYLWIVTAEPIFRNPWLVAAWVAAMAFLMISNIATMSWKSIRPRRSIRLEAIALVGLVFAALLMEPFWTLAGICVVYLALMPLGIAKYAKVRRLRADALEPQKPVPAEPADAGNGP